MTRLSVLQLAVLKALRAEEIRSRMVPAASNVDPEDWAVAKRLEDRGLVALTGGKFRGEKWTTARLTEAGRDALKERS